MTTDDDRDSRSQDANVVPVLTEVVPGLVPVTVDPGPAAHQVAQAAEIAAHAAGFVMDEEAIVEQVMERFAKQIDHLYEYRVGEVLQPLLEQLAQATVTQVRSELASTLRDVVRRAVQQEVVRQRLPRPPSA